MPSWQRASTQALEGAAAEQRPIVVFFEGEKSTDFDLYGDDFAELSNMDAMFIKIAYTVDREKSPWAEDSVVPVNKLLSDNPSRDFGVKPGSPTVIVCDWHGNEFERTDDKVKAATLKTCINRVAKKVESAEKSVQRHLDKARQELDKDNKSNAIRSLLNAFGTGYVGYDSVVEATRMYHDLMDELRGQKEELLEAGDTAGLRELAKIVRKTDLEDEVSAAIKEAASAARKK